MIDPHTPLNNTIIFYILLVIALIITRPKSIYCYRKQKFKSFGNTNDDTTTLFPFSFICISSSIVFYLFFSILDSMCSIAYE